MSEPRDTRPLSPANSGREAWVDALVERYPRAAISHEWLTVPGGSENVVLAILDLLPQAELYTTIYDPAPWPPRITGRPIHASWLSHIPGARRHYPRLLPLMDSAFRSFDLAELDLVVSSNHACAKNVRTPPRCRHVCYCHTPMRYAWDPRFLEGERLGPVGRAAFRLALPRLRRNDLRGARGVDSFIANSTVVAERIQRIYGRESTVIHPPVDVERFLRQPRVAREDAPYLVFGRVIPYKRVDLAVRACERLGRRLIVAGEGRDLRRVQALAGRWTTFVGRVSDVVLAELMANARGLLFPGEEDFGIVPVEAQSAGLGVIGNAAGGVRDSIVDGATGVLYSGTAVDDLVGAIERFEGLSLDDSTLRDNARRFAPEVFRARFAEALLADAA